MAKRQRRLTDDSLSVVYDSLLHTLGNLTLTGYNSSLGNESFPDKRTSHARNAFLMNQDFATHERWGRRETRARADTLSIASIWSFAIYPSGRVEVVFQELVDRPPFDDDSRRGQFQYYPYLGALEIPITHPWDAGLDADPQRFRADLQRLTPRTPSTRHLYFPAADLASHWDQLESDLLPPFTALRRASTPNDTPPPQPDPPPEPATWTPRRDKRC